MGCSPTRLLCSWDSPGQRILEWVFPCPPDHEVLAMWPEAGCLTSPSIHFFICRKGTVFACVSQGCGEAWMKWYRAHHTEPDMQWKIHETDFILITSPDNDCSLLPHYICPWISFIHSICIFWEAALSQAHVSTGNKLGEPALRGSQESGF